MNWPPLEIDRIKSAVWTIGIVGTFLLVAVLVGALHIYTRPAPLDANRVTERYGFLEAVRQADAQTLDSYQWLDREKGFLRLSLDRALELALEEWQDPVAARSNLIARVKKATEPPPAPPEPVNPYE